MGKIVDKIWVFLKGLRLPGYASIIGFLGAFAGAEGTSKMWRRLGIPIFVSVVAYMTLGWQLGWIKALWTLSCLSLWGALSLGYGIPDIFDDGSFLGRFYFKIFNEDYYKHPLTDAFTRGTIGLIQGICLVSIPILKGNWIVYFIGVVLIMLIQALISWRSLGRKSIDVFGKRVDVLWSDVINYSVFGVVVYIILSH